MKIKSLLLTAMAALFSPFIFAEYQPTRAEAKHDAYFPTYKNTTLSLSAPIRDACDALKKYDA